jgi:hypothetical protein
LYTAISIWSSSDAAAPDSDELREWEEIFDYLISQLRDDLIDCGNHMLRRAANKMLKELCSLLPLAVSVDYLF